MSFGKKSSSNDSKAASALQPANFYSPFGNLVNGTYTAVESPEQIATRNSTVSKLQNIVNNIPTSYNVNDTYNNPFYNTSLNLLKQPIDQQKQQDFKELNNTLSARNQLGSSYDAYQNYLTNQRYDNAYTQAQNQARLNSADAYQQSFDNSLSALQGLRNDYSSAMDNYYRPAELAMGYQNSVSPLQQSLANYYTNTNNRYTNRTNQLLQTGLTASSLLL